MLTKKQTVHRYLNLDTHSFLNRLLPILGICLSLLIAVYSQYPLQALYLSLAIVPLHYLNAKIVKHVKSPMLFEWGCIFLNCTYIGMLHQFSYASEFYWILNLLPLIRSQVIFIRKKNQDLSIIVITLMTALAVSFNQTNLFKIALPTVLILALGLVHLTVVRFLKDQAKMLKVARAYFSQAHDMIFLISQKGEILDINEAAEKKLGYSPLELQNKLFFDTLFVDTEREYLKKLRQRWQQGKEIFLIDEEFQVMTKDGEVLKVLINNTSLKGAQEETVTSIATLEDVSEKRQMEDELANKRAQDEYTAKMASLGEMSGGIAHEINNPLTIIIGFAQKIESSVKEKKVDVEKIVSYSQKIQNTSMRVTKIVKGLVRFARQGAQEPLVISSMKTILDDTLLLCSEKFKNLGIDLQTEQVEDMIFPCRPVQVSEVMLNLLNNAKDAINNQDNKWIKVIAYEQNRVIHIRITDCGGGIEPKIVKKIFQPFYTTKPVGKGTGIGMSISRSIIEGMNGSLDYELCDGHTSFIIKIPRQAIEESTAS